MAQESYAWNCPCGRLCGKRHVHCSGCKGHWSLGVPPLESTQEPTALQPAGSLELAPGCRLARRRSCSQEAESTTAQVKEYKSEEQMEGQRQTARGGTISLPANYIDPLAPARDKLCISDTASTSCTFNSCWSCTGYCREHGALLAVTKHYPDINKAPVNIQLRWNAPRKPMPNCLESISTKPPVQSTRQPRSFAI